MIGATIILVLYRPFSYLAWLRLRILAKGVYSLRERLPLRLVRALGNSYSVHPSINPWRDEEIARAASVAVYAGIRASQAYGGNLKSVTIEMDDGTRIVAWKESEGVIGIIVSGGYLIGKPPTAHINMDKVTVE